MSRAQDRVSINTEDEYGALGSKERRRNLQKHSNLVSLYGITLKTYNDMHAAQNGLCAICGEAETLIHRRGGYDVRCDLAVDHDHNTGDVRSLLCSKCNKALGLLNDDPDLILKAVEYLKAHAVGG